MKVKTSLAVMAAAICSAFAAQPPFEADFSKLETMGEWAQSTSGYYQPLGKVEQTPDGLRLEANDKTMIIIHDKQKFAAGAGDQIELTIHFQCERDAYVHLGLYEYKNAGWTKNDFAEFWAKPGMSEMTKTITIRPGADVNRAAIAFGVGKNGQILIKKVCGKLKGADPSMAKRSDLPPGLLLHLDGSRIGAMEVKDGRVVLWKDFSGKGNDVRPAKDGSAPALLEKGVNQLPMVRFDGKEEMATSAPLSMPSGVTAFVLFRREAAQSGGEGWQDSLYWGDGKGPDNTGRTHLSMGAGAGEEFPRIAQHSSEGSFNAPLLIGSNAGVRGFLKGDVGEILVFERDNLSAAEIEKIRGYLLQKWNFSEDDYVRFGPLPPGPKRVSDALPLSDQEDKGKWRRIDAMSDEFNGGELDRAKWTDQVFYTLGSAPVRTLPDNLKIKDGMAQITNIYDPAMPSGRLEPRGPEYHSFSTGMLQSVFMLRYGYIEARLKIQPTSFNNAFWLIGAGIEKATGREAVPEIDIFELAGKSFAHTYSYNMAIHCVQKKPEYKHFAYGRNWRSNFKFTNDFHVYGLEWTPKAIRYYIDGVKVRDFKVKENLWDVPMTIHFNSLPHFDWFGTPDEKDFPCTYFIDYLRVWKNPETDVPDDWEQKYKITHMTKTSGFAYDYYNKNGNKIVPQKTEEKPSEAAPLEAVETEEAAAKWKPMSGAGVKYENGGTVFKFPAVASRKDNGEVQYAAPSTQWPRAELPGADLKTSDWAGHNYLSVEFENPSRSVEGCTLRVALENGQELLHPILMKSGKGVAYWQIPEPVKKEKIKSLVLNVRGSDRPVEFKLLSLKIEK